MKTGIPLLRSFIFSSKAIPSIPGITRSARTTCTPGSPPKAESFSRASSPEVVPMAIRPSFSKTSDRVFTIWGSSSTMRILSDGILAPDVGQSHCHCSPPTFLALCQDVAPVFLHYPFYYGQPQPRTQFLCRIKGLKDVGEHVHRYPWAIIHHHYFHLSEVQDTGIEPYLPALWEGLKAIHEEGGEGRLNLSRVGMELYPFRSRYIKGASNLFMPEGRLIELAHPRVFWTESLRVCRLSLRVSTSEERVSSPRIFSLIFSTFKRATARGVLS